MNLNSTFRACAVATVVSAVSLAAAVVTPSSVAADPRDQFEACVYRDADGAQLPYRLLKPKDYNASRKYPLVLFFHGAGERGEDNQRQLVHGMGEFASEPMMEAHPCFVIAPQCPKNAQWVDTPWSADSHSMPKSPSVPMKLALELVVELQREYSIDASRLYVTGLSMGGFGTWDAVQRHPDWFAAAVPICGGGDVALARKLADVPVWVFHGGSDHVVKTQRSRDMVSALQDVGASPKYTEYPGVGHNSWSATYADPEMYKWLFSQHR